MSRSIIKGPLEDGMGNILYNENSSDMIKHNKGNAKQELEKHDALLLELLSQSKPYLTTNLGNAYSVTLLDPITTLTDGYPITIKFNTASNGAITVNPNEIENFPVVDYYGVPINNVRTNLVANLRYDATSKNFILLGKGGGDPTATATANQVLSPYTISTSTGTIKGLVSSKLGETFTPTTVNQRIKAGQYIKEDQLILGDPKLVSENVKANVTIFNTTGKDSVVDTADGTIIASDIPDSKIGYTNGSRLIGTAPVYDSVTINPGTSDNTIIPAKSYVSGSIIVKGDSNLIPKNIVNGLSIFGVSGNAYATASGTAVVDSTPYNHCIATCSTISFPFQNVIFFTAIGSGINMTYQNSPINCIYKIFYSKDTGLYVIFGNHSEDINFGDQLDINTWNTSFIQLGRQTCNLNKCAGTISWYAAGY